MAQNKDKFTFINMNIDILQRNVFIVVCFVGFIDVFKVNHRGKLLPRCGFGCFRLQSYI